MPKRLKPLLPVGTQAPAFSLHDTPDRQVSLEDFVGSPVVLLFYVADFNPVCVREMTVFNEVLPEFHRRGAQVLGISPDNVWSHIAFSLQYNLHFPLLSDFYPRDKVSSAYRVPKYRGELEERTAYVIDKNGRVAWTHTAPPGVAMDTVGPFEAVERLAHNGLPVGVL